MYCRRVTATELTIEHREEGFALASWEHVLISVWWRQLRLEDLDNLQRVQRAFLRHHDKIAAVTVLRATIRANVGDGIREKSAELAREFGERVFGSAVVIEASGVRATVFRSILTGISLLSRSPSATKPFSDVRSACDWALNHEGTPKDAHAATPVLARLIRELVESEA